MTVDQACDALAKATAAFNRATEQMVAAESSPESVDRMQKAGQAMYQAQEIVSRLTCSVQGGRLVQSFKKTGRWQKAGFALFRKI